MNMQFLYSIYGIYRKLYIGIKTYSPYYPSYIGAYTCILFNGIRLNSGQNDFMR